MHVVKGVSVGEPNANDGHPTYPRPTVREAICEIVIEQPPIPTFSVSRPGDIFGSLIGKYPQFQPQPSPGLPHGGLLGQFAFPIGAQSLQFSSPELSRQIVIGDRFFRLHQLAPYPGWPSLSEELLSLWKIFASFARPVSVQRMAVRYLNVINRTAEHPRASDWLRPTPAISALALESIGKRPFVSRTESWLSETDLTIVSVGQTPGNPHDVQPIVLDTEQSRNGLIEASEASLTKLVNELHEGVWKQFKSAQTDLLEAYLEGR